jgi:hypothetical protein
MQQYYVSEDDSFMGIQRVRLMSDFDRGVVALVETVDERARIKVWAVCFFVIHLFILCTYACYLCEGNL